MTPRVSDIAYGDYIAGTELETLYNVAFDIEQDLNTALGLLEQWLRGSYMQSYEAHSAYRTQVRDLVTRIKEKSEPT